MHEVHAEPAERVGLLGVGRVEEPGVEDDVARRRSHGVLEANRHPGVALVAPGKRLRRGSVCDREEPGAVAAGCCQPLVEEAVFVVEHPLHPLP